MSSKTRFVAIAVILTSLWFCQTLGVTVSHRARALHPGEVILLSVSHDRDVETISGRAFEKEIVFFRSARLGVWQGLIGIDLEIAPGAYCVELTVKEAGGATLTESYPLEVLAKAFPTRYLTVSANYVNPPESVTERIRSESEELSAILSQVSEMKLWQGQFAPPVPGLVISAFGKRSVLNGTPRGLHAGVDLRAQSGTPLKAPANGRVVLAKELYFAGNAVILDHGLGLYSFFGHLSRLGVQVGNEVEKGQVIGKTGVTGRVSGPHLHWSVRLNDARVDPMSLLAVAQEARPSLSRATKGTKVKKTKGTRR